MLKALNQLETSTLAELEQLKRLCKLSDESIPNTYPHVLTESRPVPATVLYWENNKLVGFLSIYFFYEHAVEVALLVHPAARRKGVATRLLNHIMQLIKQHKCPNLIFSSPLHFNDQWLLKSGFIYQHSEYYMERHLFSPLITPQPKLTYRIAQQGDIPQLCLLDKACFNKNNPNLRERFVQLLSERSYQIIVAFVNETLVGKVHIRWQEKGASFSDIAIFPDYQGQGLGAELISHCVNIALSEGKPCVSLDVETHNHKALDLYKRLGFTTQNACDYWLIERSALEQKLHITS